MPVHEPHASIRASANLSPLELGRAQGHSETSRLPPLFVCVSYLSRPGRTSMVRCDRDMQATLRVLVLVELRSCRRIRPGASIPASQGAVPNGCSLPRPGHRSVLARSSCSMRQHSQQAALLHRCSRACQSSVRRGAASLLTSQARSVAGVSCIWSAGGAYGFGSSVVQAIAPARHCRPPLRGSDAGVKVRALLSAMLGQAGSRKLADDACPPAGSITSLTLESNSSGRGSDFSFLVGTSACELFRVQCTPQVRLECLAALPCRAVEVP